MLWAHPFLLLIQNTILAINSYWRATQNADTTISDTVYLAHFHTYKKQNTKTFFPFTSTSLSTHSVLFPFGFSKG